MTAAYVACVIQGYSGYSHTSVSCLISLLLLLLWLRDFDYVSLFLSCSFFFFFLLCFNLPALHLCQICLCLLFTSLFLLLSLSSRLSPSLSPAIGSCSVAMVTDLQLESCSLIFVSVIKVCVCVYVFVNVKLGIYTVIHHSRLYAIHLHMRLTSRLGWCS